MKGLFKFTIFGIMLGCGNGALELASIKALPRTVNTSEEANDVSVKKESKSVITKGNVSFEYLGLAENASLEQVEASKEITLGISYQIPHIKKEATECDEKDVIELVRAKREVRTKLLFVPKGQGLFEIYSVTGVVNEILKLSQHKFLTALGSCVSVSGSVVQVCGVNREFYAPCLASKQCREEFEEAWRREDFAQTNEALDELYRKAAMATDLGLRVTTKRMVWEPSDHQKIEVVINELSNTKVNLGDAISHIGGEV